jgi:hypothetical protein
MCPGGIGTTLVRVGDTRCFKLAVGEHGPGPACRLGADSELHCGTRRRSPPRRARRRLRRLARPNAAHAAMARAGPVWAVWLTRTQACQSRWRGPGPGRQIGDKHPRIMTGARAANPTDVPSEARSQWIQHQTLEIFAFIAPDTELILAASFVTGTMLSLSSFVLRLSL